MNKLNTAVSVRARRGLLALLAVESLAELGTRVSQIAIPWMVLAETGSPTLAGLVGTAEIAPFVVMQLLGGPLVDRVGPRSMMLMANLLAGGLLLLVPIMSILDQFNIAAILGAVFVAGFCRGPADVAARVILPDVCALAQTPIDRGAALADGAGRTAMLVGAPAAGVSIGLFGGAISVFLTSAALIAAGAGTLLIPVAPRVDDRQSESNVRLIFSELGEGFAFVRKDSLLRSICSVVFVCNFADAALTGLLLLLWVQDKSGDASQVGLMLAILAGCAVAGTTCMAVAGSRLPRRWTFAFAFLIVGAPRFVVLLLPIPFWSVLLVWAAAGFAAGAINPLIASAQYERIPTSLRSRALGTVTALAWLGVPFGALIAGTMVDAVGLTPTLSVFAVAYLLVTLDPFVRSTWKGFDRRPSEPEQSSV